MTKYIFLNHSIPTTNDEYMLCENIKYLAFTSPLTREVISGLFIITLNKMF